MTDFDVQAAIKSSMQTEKDAMDFYKYGAEKMTDEKAKRVFEQLAREELQHAKMFYNIYKGEDISSFEAFINEPPNTESSWWKGLQQLTLHGFDERRALELAIEEEERLENELREKAAQISDPEVKQVYLANAQSTHNHFEICEEEHKAIYG